MIKEKFVPSELFDTEKNPSTGLYKELDKNIKDYDNTIKSTFDDSKIPTPRTKKIKVKIPRNSSEKIPDIAKSFKNKKLNFNLDTNPETNVSDDLWKVKNTNFNSIDIVNTEKEKQKLEINFEPGDGINKQRSKSGLNAETILVKELNTFISKDGLDNSKFNYLLDLFKEFDSLLVPGSGQIVGRINVLHTGLRDTKRNTNISQDTLNIGVTNYDNLSDVTIYIWKNEYVKSKASKEEYIRKNLQKDSTKISGVIHISLKKDNGYRMFNLGIKCVPREGDLLKEDFYDKSNRREMILSGLGIDIIKYDGFYSGYFRFIKPEIETIGNSKADKWTSLAKEILFKFNQKFKKSEMYLDNIVDSYKKNKFSLNDLLLYEPVIEESERRYPINHRSIKKLIADSLYITEGNYSKNVRQIFLFGYINIVDETINKIEFKKDIDIIPTQVAVIINDNPNLIDLGDFEWEGGCEQGMSKSMKAEMLVSIPDVVNKEGFIWKNKKLILHLRDVNGNFLPTVLQLESKI